MTLYYVDGKSCSSSILLQKMPLNKCHCLCISRCSTRTSNVFTTCRTADPELSCNRSNNFNSFFVEFRPYIQASVFLNVICFLASPPPPPDLLYVHISLVSGFGFVFLFSFSYLIFKFLHQCSECGVWSFA